MISVSPLHQPSHWAEEVTYFDSAKLGIIAVFLILQWSLVTMVTAASMACGRGKTIWTGFRQKENTSEKTELRYTLGK